MNETLRYANFMVLCVIWASSRKHYYDDCTKMYDGQRFKIWLHLNLIIIFTNKGKMSLKYTDGKL